MLKVWIWWLFQWYEARCLLQLDANALGLPANSAALRSCCVFPGNIVPAGRGCMRQVTHPLSNWLVTAPVTQGVQISSFTWLFVKWELVSLLV